MPPVNFPPPSQILSTYQISVKALKPGINENDPSGEVFIRGRVLTGIVSGVYGDQRAIDDDTFIRDARPAALLRHGADLNIFQQPATASDSNGCQFSGTPGTPIPVGTVVRFDPTGVLYTLQIAGVLSVGGTFSGTILCNQTGQIGNVANGSDLTLVSPIAGVNPTAMLITALADGSDIESFDSYRTRLLNRLQNPPAGGNESDYPNFAFLADPSVRSASIRRFGRGLGTVDVYVTSGTTDIDTAVTNGIAVVRIPSMGVLANIQAYYDANVPLTDCPLVIAPTELGVNVTVNVALANGILLTTIPADVINNPLNLNVQQLIQREISRVLYKIPVGGRTIPSLPGMGFVIAADIETQLDVMLSAVLGSGGVPIGLIPVLLDREVQKLDGANYNYPLIGNQLAAPAVSTVVIGV